MNEQWEELKETITELRDNDGTGTQQEVCKFLVNYMDVLEKQTQAPCEDAISREDALMCLTGEIKETDTIETIIARFVRRIRKLPPVNPQPKTVLYSGDGYADGYMVYDMAECPNCGYEYEDGDKDWGLPFCPSCGQKLNWESEEA